MKKNLIIPKFISNGIKRKASKANPDVLLFGGDTETVNGAPHTLQLCGKDGVELYYVNKWDILETFLEHVDRRLKRGQMAAVYFHNLNFDMPVLFSREKITLWMASQFKIERHKWTCYVNCEKRFFAKFTKQGNKTIYIIDSFAYLSTSLEKIAKLLQMSLKKLPKPEKLGEIAYRTPEFEEYAKRDAVIEYEFAKWLDNIHQQYGIKTTVSLPQMGAVIFRTMFLRPKDVIEFPLPEVVKPSLLSYHGGKNGLWAPAGVYKNCSEIDINSAYAYSMKCLPSFLKGTYVMVNELMPDLCGVYRVSGRINCPYGLFNDHSFKTVNGEFKNLWVTGFEIAAGLKYNELEIDRLMGWVWAPDPSETRNPFGEYVDYFYQKRKETPKSDPMNTFYKLGMNAVYGKTIQALERRTEEDLAIPDFQMKEGKNGEMNLVAKEKYFTAGGLFNPFIATMITARVRVMLHGLCHKFKAIHAATDSIKTLLPISGGDKELGGYKLEVNGTCVILRNKLYLHYAKDFSHCGHDPNDPEVQKRIKHGEHLCKFALHGFTGRADDLIRLIENKGAKYSVRHMFKMREALRQRKEALTMVDLPRNFNFDWKSFNENGGSEWV